VDVSSSSGSAELRARREEGSKFGLVAPVDLRALVTGSVLSRTSPAADGPQQVTNSITQSKMISPAKQQAKMSRQ